MHLAGILAFPPREGLFPVAPAQGHPAQIIAVIARDVAKPAWDIGDYRGKDFGRSAAGDRPMWWRGSLLKPEIGFGAVACAEGSVTLGDRDRG